MIYLVQKPELKEVNDVNFNYSKLLGRMREYGYTQEKLAAEIGMHEGTLNAKLKNKSYFQQAEMFAICKVLEIAFELIEEYFFCTTSSES